jgi:hypothetical protein
MMVAAHFIFNCDLANDGKPYETKIFTLHLFFVWG